MKLIAHSFELTMNAAKIVVDIPAALIVAQRTGVIQRCDAAEAADEIDHAIALSDDPALRANLAIALQHLGYHRGALEDLAVAALAAQDPDLLYRPLRIARHRWRAGDWRAHLAAHRAGDTSPFAAQIERQAADLLAGTGIQEHVA